MNNTSYASEVISFNFLTEGSSGTDVNNEAGVAFDISPVYADINTKTLGIYCLDQEKNQWVYAGGSYATGTKSIRGVMGENIEFAAIGYVSSFSDIAGSWAKEHDAKRKERCVYRTGSSF